MKDLTVLVSGIEYKAIVIKDKLNKAEAENKLLINKHKELLKIIESQEISIKSLEEKNKILKFTKVLEKGKDKTDTKLKINELVREIDKCLALLNK
jgi:hypothetical protein